MDIILQRIVEELEKQNKTQAELGEYLGVTANIVTDWKSGRLKSYRKYLHGIASFLDVSVEYLRGETDQKKKPLVNQDKELTEGEKMLLNLFRQVPVENQQLVLDMIKIALKKQ